jgi:hypothetical protein
MVRGSDGSILTGTECRLTPKVLSKVGTANDCLLISLGGGGMKSIILGVSDDCLVASSSSRTSG